MEVVGMFDWSRCGVGCIEGVLHSAGTMGEGS